MASFVASIFSSLETITPMVERYGDQSRDICAVESGTNIALSVLFIPLLPFDFVTPTTVKRTFQTRMVFPSGSAPLPKRFVTTVGPITATLSLLVFALSVINVPEVTEVLLTFSYSGVTPLIVTLVLALS